MGGCRVVCREITVKLMYVQPQLQDQGNKTGREVHNVGGNSMGKCQQAPRPNMTECKHAHTKRSADKVGSAGHVKRSDKESMQAHKRF